MRQYGAEVGQSVMDGTRWEAAKCRGSPKAAIRPPASNAAVACGRASPPCRDEPFYHRSDLAECHTAEQWRRLGFEVRRCWPPARCLPAACTGRAQPAGCALPCLPAALASASSHLPPRLTPPPRVPPLLLPLRCCPRSWRTPPSATRSACPRAPPPRPPWPPSPALRRWTRRGGRAAALRLELPSAARASPCRPACLIPLPALSAAPASPLPSPCPPDVACTAGGRGGGGRRRGAVCCAHGRLVRPLAAAPLAARPSKGRQGGRLPTGRPPASALPLLLPRPCCGCCTAGPLTVRPRPPRPRLAPTLRRCPRTSAATSRCRPSASTCPRARCALVDRPALPWPTVDGAGTQSAGALPLPQAPLPSCRPLLSSRCTQVHLKGMPHVKAVCRRLNVDFAEALCGFTPRGGMNVSTPSAGCCCWLRLAVVRCPPLATLAAPAPQDRPQLRLIPSLSSPLLPPAQVPTFDGVVICAEHEEAVVAAYNEWQR